MKFYNPSTFFIFLIIVLSLSSTFLIYQGFGASDNNTQIPILKRMMNQTYLSSDWFTNINSNTFNVLIYFHMVILFFYFFIRSLEVVYFLLYFLITLSLAFSSYFISLHFFKDERIGILNSFFILFGSTFYLGGPSMLTGMLIPGVMAFSIATWGFYFILKKKYIKCGILLGIASIIHVLVGGLIFFILSSSYILSNHKKNLKNYLKLVGVYLIFVILIFPMFLSQVTPANLSSKDQVFIMGEFRLPHHLMAFTWPLWEYIEFALFLIIFLISFKKLKISEEQKPLIKYLVLFILFLFLLGIIFLEIVPVSFMVKMQPFRLSPFLVFLEYTFISAYLFKSIETNRRKKLALPIILYILFSMSLLYHPLIIVGGTLILLLELKKYYDWR